MEFLTPIFICAVFVLIAYGLMRLALFISSTAARRMILSYGKASEEAVSALLISHFGASNVICNRYLPYRTPTGTAFTEIDCIVILRGRIAVVEVKSLVGSIYNPPSETWHQSAVMKNGEHKELDFVNPILQEAVKKLKAMNKGRRFRLRDRIKIHHVIQKSAKSKRQAMAAVHKKRRR